MQYKKLFTIPFIALSLFSTACAVQSGNVVGKESVYPPVANFPFEIKIKPLSDMDYRAVITNKKTKYSNPNIPFCTKKSIYILCSFANLSLLINSPLNCSSFTFSSTYF